MTPPLTHKKSCKRFIETHTHPLVCQNYVRWNLFSIELYILLWSHLDHDSTKFSSLIQTGSLLWCQMSAFSQRNICRSSWKYFVWYRAGFSIDVKLYSMPWLKYYMYVSILHLLLNLEWNQWVSVINLVHIHTNHLMFFCDDLNQSLYMVKVVHVMVSKLKHFLCTPVLLP